MATVIRYFDLVREMRNAYNHRLWLARQFTPAIREAIRRAAIKRAATKALRRYVASGKLDKCFRVQD